MNGAITELCPCSRTPLFAAAAGFRSRVHASRAALLAACLSLAPAAASAANNWTGAIRCEILVQAAGYSHQETQTWTLTGNAPTTQGSQIVYGATWSVTGQGWHDRTNASGSRRFASWTASVAGQSASIAFTVTPTGQLIVQKWNAQLTAQKSYTGTDQFFQNGAAQSSQPLEMTVYEFPFQRIEGSSTDTQLTGTHTSQPMAFLGPLQPSGAQVTVACAWALGQGTAPSLPPSSLPPPTSPPGSTPSPADQPRLPPGRPVGTIERPDDGGPAITPTQPTPVGPPSDPSNFTAVQTGPGLVELRWDAVPGVTTYAISGAGLPEGRKVDATATTITGLPVGVHEWLVTSWYDPDGSRTRAQNWPRASVEVKAFSGRYRVTATRLKVHREEPDQRFKLHGRNNEIFITEHTQVVDRRTGQTLQYDGTVSHPGVTPMIHASPVHGDTHNANTNDAQYRIRAGSVAASGGIQTGDEIPTWDANQMAHRNQTQPSGRPTEGLATHPSPGIFLTTEYQPFVVWEGELNQGVEVVLIRPVVWLAIQTWGGGSTDQFLAPYVARINGPDRTRNFVTLSGVRSALDRESVLITRAPEVSITGQWLVDRHRPFGLTVSGNQNGASATWNDLIVVLTHEKTEAFLAGRTSRELEVRIRGTMRGQNAIEMGDVSLFLKIERGPDTPSADRPTGPVEIVPPPGPLPPREPRPKIDGPVSMGPISTNPEVPHDALPPGRIGGGPLNTGDEQGPIIREPPKLTEVGAPEDPPLFTARQTGPSSVELRWMAVPGVSGYLIYGPAAENGITFTGTSATVSGLAPGTYRWFIASLYGQPGQARTDPATRPSASVEVKLPTGHYRITAETVHVHKDEGDNPGPWGDGRACELYVTSFAQVIDRTTGQELAKGPLFRSPVHGEAGGNPPYVRAGSWGANGGIQTGDVVPLRKPAASGSGHVACSIWEGELRAGIDVLLLRPVLWEYDGVEGPWFIPYMNRLLSEAPGALFQVPDLLAVVNEPSISVGELQQFRQTGPWTPDHEDHPIGCVRAPTGGGGLVAGSDPDLTFFDRILVVTQEKLEPLLDANNGTVVVDLRFTGEGRPWIADCTLRLKFERSSPSAGSTSSSGSSEALRDAVKKLLPKIVPGP